MKQPKISIITVVFNALEDLKQTYNAIAQLNYPNIEWVVIDGNSNDGTIEWLKQRQNLSNNWISEKDKGLYDAMNKGILNSTGEYLWFINAGDLPSDKEVLTNVKFNNQDVIYGKAAIIDDSGKIINERIGYPKTLNWKSFRFGMNVSHQALIVKKSIVGTYDLSYKICADIDWVIQLLKKAETIENTNIILAKFKTGGVSSNRFLKAWKERYAILKHHYGTFPNLINHSWIILRWFYLKLTQKANYRP